MIDFWEAIGRLATYERLNSKFVAILPPPAMIQAVEGYVAFNSQAPGLNIPPDQYQRVQDFFEPLLTENYLSLMAAGELIWAYSFEKSREAMKKLIPITDRYSVDLYGPSTRYFITLGALISDQYFRRDLTQENTRALKLIERLSDPEKHTIIDLAANDDFNKAAVEFCLKPWEIGCNVFIFYWSGHLHSLAVQDKSQYSESVDAWQKTDEPVAQATAV